jgi:hypothetical protein
MMFLLHVHALPELPDWLQEHRPKPLSAPNGTSTIDKGTQEDLPRQAKFGDYHKKNRKASQK